MRQTILIHPEAPPKPAVGAACNGCGMCCAAEPCPVGVLVSRSRTGACRALLWDGARYRCGMVDDPGRFLPLRLGPLRSVVAKLAARTIAAGIGCDADFQIDSA